MGFFEDAISTMQTLVFLAGAIMAIIGLIQWATANSQDNPAGKTTAGLMIVSGIMVAVIGIALVPQLANMW